MWSDSNSFCSDTIEPHSTSVSCPELACSGRLVSWPPLLGPLCPGSVCTECFAGRANQVGQHLPLRHTRIVSLASSLSLPPVSLFRAFSPPVCACLPLISHPSLLVFSTHSSASHFYEYYFAICPFRPVFTEFPLLMSGVRAVVLAAAIHRCRWEKVVYF